MKTSEVTDYTTHTIDADGQMQIRDLGMFNIILSATYLDARTYVRFGQHHTRNAPTLKATKAKYGLPSNVRSFADALPYLEELRETIREELDRRAALAA